MAAPARSPTTDIEAALHNVPPADETTPLLVSQRPDATTEATPAVKSPRLLYLDHIRGLLMVLQSIDHSRLFLSRIQIKHEEWWDMPDFHGSVYHWFVRFLTSVCAPGFMVTMGISILLFTMSRYKLGWHWSSILKHFFIRGFVLIVVNWVMYPMRGFVTTVLFALGMNIFFGACIVGLEALSTERIATLFSRTESSSPRSRSPSRPRSAVTASTEAAYRKAVTVSLVFYVILAAVITSLASIYTPSPSHADDNYNFFFKLFFLPQKMAKDGLFYSMYPPIPWLGMVIWGIALQRGISVFKLSSRSVGFLHAMLAVFLWIIFVPVRLNMGFGNINPGELHPSPRESFVNFFNLTKYPPSIAYTTCTLGIVHALCALFIMLELKLRDTAWTSLHNPLVVFGRSAFFFYVLHFYVYRGFRMILKLAHVVSGEEWNGQPYNLPDAWYWFSWVLGLVVLYFACARYGKFKAGTAPESIWRFF